MSNYIYQNLTFIIGNSVKSCILSIVKLIGEYNRLLFIRLNILQNDEVKQLLF